MGEGGGYGYFLPVNSKGFGPLFQQPVYEHMALNAFFCGNKRKKVLLAGDRI